jgi:phospholipid transport system substrate-binding protein
MLIHSRIFLALLGAVPCLVFAQDGLLDAPENARAKGYGNEWECGKGYREADESCLVTTLAFANAGSTDTQPDDPDLPQPKIEKMIDDLLDALSANAEQIKQDPSVAYELSNELVVPYIDFPRITRIIIGKYWRDANDEQRQRLTDEISALLIRSYVTAMSAYADDTLLDEQVVYQPSRYQAGDRKATVRAAISLDSGETINVRYALYRTHDQWKIYDISFENVSLALTYRVSFGDIIKKNGLNDLISQLENRNKKGEVNLPGVVTKKMDEAAAAGSKKDTP